MDLVARVLAMHVLKRVVRMPLVVESPDTGPLESRWEPELPPKRRLDIPGERPRRSTVRSQHGVDVIVCSAERQEAPVLALRKYDACNEPKRSSRGCDRPVVLEPERHVKSDRLACSSAIGRGRIKTMVGCPFVEASSDR